MLIFLYGEDSFRSRNKLNELKEKFLREIDPQGNSLSTIDGSMANFSQINESISPSSLFASKRMVVIENIFANSKKTILDEILNYLKILKSDENIVIFWDEISGEKMSKNKLFNFLSKKGEKEKRQKFVQKFSNLSNPQIVDWIKKQVEQENVNITNAVAAEMVAMFGANLRQISNELKKIINFKKGNSGEQGAAIQKEDILLMSRGNFNENIFALTDAISQKNKALALSLFEQELEGGTADTYLVHMITRQIKILLQIKEALEQGLTPRKIINKLKFHPFVVQKTSVQAKNFTLAKLKNILSLLVYIDQKIKTGKVDAKTGLELLIVKI
ncbi:DNA polymerase III subunit delta [Candidatus Falkowbacteria bacterium RIFOXYB2_FULL_34_18]|uniref:DNA polymerase III subunit delta n=1 Tax=Candidatus Falkowbacteria bacterium RIFOXYD2_FULL_34_120 TaxID=1798007 RepID=A0A1F5TQI0_9BACT|nr:MAG: DNA polymerase III subunit delta [Candidatus Falkowbacteria bacterium RIFOXYB2_FULL_34_18]OGF29066.1 MAG: DNA polymerase III subunit delta [Candidatus Falkowbacteria bacterium RIFOXYC12_FULL_34_55]OGF36124.1 MAG: DNA polymerase III subunit delta [Candidatus Falkowbacteria bacterium RIFOXYC2_FULL_34_220]OGF38576.1 MAG: DNA polymerase III subunit delta [Candidatus Falkowbacteria bacterium RIFOXYD12_FULL_34_57]OGF40751.1 MAG: DNA polymerase III subunit delta [Candidatus Falkowbacteria bact